MTDIANHLASVLALPQKDTAADVFLLLGKEKIISKRIANRMKDACGFRKLHRNYKDDLADLRHFAKQIYEFLEKNK